MKAGDIGKLCAAVRRYGSDTHLGHHFEHARGSRGDVIGTRLIQAELAELAGDAKFIDSLKCHIWVNRIGAKGNEHGQVVDLAGIAGFNNQRSPSARALSHHVLVYSGSQQQGRNRCKALIGIAV